MTWMTTRSGKQVMLESPTSDMIDVRDIAYSLSRTPRFLGHTYGPVYSVAQHCCLVAKKVPHSLFRAALFHDAAEAYIGDISQPLKKLLSVGNNMLSSLEDRLIHTIFTALEIRHPSHQDSAIIKIADHSALLTEKRDLMYDDGVDWSEWCVEGAEAWSDTISPWSERAAYDIFLNYAGVWRSENG